MSYLSSDFFDYIGATYGVSTLVCHPKFPGMILFDKKKNKPLSYLMVKPVNTTTTTETDTTTTTVVTHGDFAVYPRAAWSGATDHQWFQASGNMDQQKFELVFTNLCHEGMQQFGIRPLGTDGVSKLGCVNKVNCIKPMSSYAVKANALQGSCEFILSMLKESVVDPATGETTIRTISIEDAESMNVLKGVYLAIKVMPEVQHRELWSDTEWRTVDMFSMDAPKPVVYGYSSPFETNNNNIYPATYGPALPLPPGTPMAYGVRNTTYSFGAPTGYSFGGSDQASSSHGTTMAFGMPSDHSRGRSYGGSFDSSTPVRGGFGSTVSLGGSATGGGFGAPGSGGFGSASPNLMQESKICELKSGEHVQVNSTSITATFASDTPFQHCVLALTVIPDGRIKFIKEPLTRPQLLEQAKHLIEEAKATADVKMMDSIPKTFQSDHCVICLDQPAVTTIAMCGHICLCEDAGCLDGVSGTCPLCRRWIQAKIRAV